MKQMILALSLVAACSSSAKKDTGPDHAGQGRTHAFQIGSLEAIALQDGELTMPNDGKVLGVGHVQETGDLLAAAGLSRDEFSLSIQPLLVKSGDRVILFDTGAGGSFPNTGWLPASLAQAGVAPGAITDVFISHMHGDHTGGLVANGKLVFPNATVRMASTEWTALQASADDKALVAAIGAKVTPFEPGAQVFPDVQAVDTHGHTPGHSSFVIGTGDDRLFYLGDIAHHSVVSVQAPTFPIAFDGGNAEPIAVRQQMLATLAADGNRVYAVHFPFPGLGRFVNDGDHQAWQAE